MVYDELGVCRTVEHVLVYDGILEKELPHKCFIHETAPEQRSRCEAWAIRLKHVLRIFSMF